MGLFDRLTKAREHKAKEKAAAAAEEEKERRVKDAEASHAIGKSSKKTVASKSTKKPAESKKKKEVQAIPIISGSLSRILVTPWVSEKAARHADAGTYVFRVPRDANKVEVRKAVEALWGVNVASVRTISGKGKVFKSQARRGKRVDWKKALVTLKKGQTIDLYEGV